MSDRIFTAEVSRREAMKTAMKAGAYAAPVILAASVPGAVSAANAISFGGSGPTITGVTPPGGPTTGGTVVTLTGTNFCAGATITVNGVTATNVTVVNSTTITFTTPPGAQGAATITVTCPNGTGTGTFTYHTITVTGEAYTANASVLGVLSVSKVGDVILPPGGSNNAVAVNLLPTLSLTAGANSALDISTPGNGTAQSRATVATASLLTGALTATALSAQTTSTSNGITASSTPVFSGIVTIGANTFNLATTAQNFTVPVALLPVGVASVTLNRVVTNTTGANSNQTVTALSVALTGLPLLGGATTVDIAVATSGVTST